MKIKDVRKLKGKDLGQKIVELKTELIKLQGQSATGTPPKSPGQIRQIKQVIARIKTVQRESELAAMIAKPVVPVEEKKTEVN